MARLSEWISVKEKLPNRGEWCVTWQDGFPETNKFTEEGRWKYCYGMNITHWMPLPEPPKEDA